MDDVLTVEVEEMEGGRKVTVTFTPIVEADEDFDD